MKKILTIRKIILNIFVESAILFMYAVGKGLIKFSNHYRHRTKIHTPESATSDAILKNLNLRK